MHCMVGCAVRREVEAVNKGPWLVIMGWEMEVQGLKGG